MNRIAILLVLSILATRVSAQYFQVTNIKEGSGLPSSETYMTFEDSKGFIWIATDNGVVKYDGHEFVIYNTKRGLADNTVFGFFEDHKGRIWFRTYNGHLSYYENDTIKAYRYNAQVKQAAKSHILTRIVYDSLGQMYFSTARHALSKVDTAGNVTEVFETKTSETFFGFVGDEPLIATSGMPRELKTIRIGSKGFDIDIDDPSNQNTWATGSVKWKGKYYFTIHKNIFEYDGKTVKKVFRASNSFLSLFVDRSDRLWAGYFNNGVDVFSDTSFKDPLSFPVLEGLSISSVMQDYEDGIWISTLDQGVFYFPNLNIQNYNPPNKTRVSAAAFAGDEIFFGNYSGEVYTMSPDGNIRLISTVVAPVSYLFLDGERKLWISDGAGTHIHQTETYIGGVGNQAKSFKSLIQSGNTVFGCNSMGVFKMSLDGAVLGKQEDRKRPSSIALAGNEIFVGGLTGVERFDQSLNVAPRQITDIRTSFISRLDSRFVAIGTISQGLLIYDVVNDHVFSLPFADEVNNIYSIVHDWPQKRVWLGTDKGLFQLDFEKDSEELVLHRFSKADGLISNKINSVCRIGTKIWAITDHGISSVPLDHFNERDVIPKFYVKRILFTNQSIAAYDGGVLRTEEEDMVIDVRAVTFKDHPTLFRYRLNENDNWKVIQGGSIFLTDLRPKEYTIAIQASSGGGKWTGDLLLHVDILAKWYESWTFRIAAVVLLIVVAYVVYRVRINTIRRRQKILELINLHQAKLIDSEIRTQERERKRIATDLHDGIGTSLSSIKMQIADAMRNEDQSRAKEINDNLTDVIDDIKRIVYDLHPPGLERYGLHAGLKSMIDRVIKNTDINVIFDYYGQREVSQSTSITIFRILQELINNTLKHARASEIRVHINEFDDEINIMYEDNGIGMVGSRFSGLGLHSIESRVRSLNGRMTWESNHKGTFYNFDIPF